MNNEINVPRVRGGDPIRAADWNKIVDRINAGTTAVVRPTLPKTPPRRELFVFNASPNAIPPGGVARITGFKTTFENETDARNKILNGAIVLTVDAARGSSSDFLVVATEPILPERVGDAKFCGACFFAFVSNLTSATKYANAAADSSLAAASSGGAFQIVVANASAGIALLTPFQEATGENPFIVDYIEKQSTRKNGGAFGDPSVVVAWRPRHYVTGTTFYDQDYPSLDALLNAKITLELCVEDWEGKEPTGAVNPDTSIYCQSKTPVVCDVEAEILTANVYESDDADDKYLIAYRSGLRTFPPLFGKAFFPYQIALGFWPWDAADWDDRRLYPNAGNLAYGQGRIGDRLKSVLLDHPRRRFATLDECPAVFFRDGEKRFGNYVYCPRILVPVDEYCRLEWALISEVGETTTELAPRDRSFKLCKYDQINPTRRLRVPTGDDYDASDVGSFVSLRTFDGVPEGGSAGGHTWDAAETPTNAVASVSDENVTITWTAPSANRSHFAEYIVDGELKGYKTGPPPATLPYYGPGQILISGINVVGQRSEPAIVEVAATE